MQRKVKSFDVRIISKPRKRWWGLFTDRQEHAVLVASIALTKDSKPFLCYCEMTDKGFAITMEQSQLSGEITSKQWRLEETFRINGKASEDRFKEMLGRSAPKPLPAHAKLTTAQAIAYIFNLPDWQLADIDYLVECKTQAENVENGD
jgi:hypothetical protein